MTLPFSFRLRSGGFEGKACGNSQRRVEFCAVCGAVARPLASAFGLSKYAHARATAPSKSLHLIQLKPSLWTYDAVRNQVVLTLEGANGSFSFWSELTYGRLHLQCYLDLFS